MNVEHDQDSVQALVTLQSNTTGWDPFQVWLTRVREPQLQAATAANSRSHEVAPALKKAS